MNDILTEKNNLQRNLNEMIAELEQGSYDLSTPVRERFTTVLYRVLPHAGTLNFSDGEKELEPLLQEMILSLKDVLMQGDEKAAEEILKALVECIDYLIRTGQAFSAMSERERASKRHKVIDRMNLLVSLRRSLALVERQISGLKESQDELDRKQKLAAEQMEDDRQAGLELKRELALFKAEGEIGGPAFLAYVRHVNDFIRSSNISRRNAIVLERQNELKGRIEGMLYSLNMMIFGTPELLGNLELTRLELTAKDFKDDLAASGEQIEKLESISEDMGAAIDELGTEAARKNQARIEKGRKLLEKYRHLS